MVGDLLQPSHLLMILVVALLVLGPKRLPEVGRSLGRGLRDFRDAMSGDDKPDALPEYPSADLIASPAATPPVAVVPVEAAMDTGAPAAPTPGTPVDHAPAPPAPAPPAPPTPAPPGPPAPSPPAPPPPAPPTPSPPAPPATPPPTPAAHPQGDAVEHAD